MRPQASPAAATPDIVLSAVSGPPTITVTVQGAGFGADEAVDIYFDTTAAALASANGTGNFPGGDHSSQGTPDVFHRIGAESGKAVDGGLWVVLQLLARSSNHRAKAEPCSSGQELAGQAARNSATRASLRSLPRWASIQPSRSGSTPVTRERRA